LLVVKVIIGLAVPNHTTYLNVLIGFWIVHYI
jgi:hypothetical protein